MKYAPGADECAQCYDGWTISGKGCVVMSSASFAHPFLALCVSFLLLFTTF